LAGNEICPRHCSGDGDISLSGGKGKRKERITGTKVRLGFMDKAQLLAGPTCKKSARSAARSAESLIFTK